MLLLGSAEFSTLHVLHTMPLFYQSLISRGAMILQRANCIIKINFHSMVAILLGHEISLPLGAIIQKKTIKCQNQLWCKTGNIHTKMHANLLISHTCCINWAIFRYIQVLVAIRMTKRSTVEKNECWGFLVAWSPKTHYRYSLRIQWFYIHWFEITTWYCPPLNALQEVKNSTTLPLYCKIIIILFYWIPLLLHLVAKGSTPMILGATMEDQKTWKCVF